MNTPFYHYPERTGKRWAKRILALFLAGAFIAAFSFAAYADWKEQREEEFFTYRRFFLRQGLIDVATSDGRAQEDLKSFYRNFTDGLYAMSAGQLDKAEEHIKSARLAWPEYYGSDFLLGLIYEQKGDTQLAARYYKSYLNKLRYLQQGSYRISEPLIRSLNPAGVERYDLARQLVRERLARHGIDLGKVRPAITPPEFLISLIIAAVLVVLYGLIQYKVWPFLRRQYRIKHAPEGYWVCRICGATNPDTAKVCSECDRPRPDGQDGHG
ncbi:MAG: hypothetical protein GF409_05860 [Candidatus Omnitrophica bacterium]|nr:hypothetical protein [Candidatus Omnitrophota bacterium]